VTERTWVSWSSGKDSTLALADARADPELEVVGLLTTLNRSADRVAMHAVRRELLLAQADAVGLPVHQVELPWPCSNEEYERLMTDAVAAARSAGVTRMVFGDLFLADVRAYREEALAGSGIEPVFPLWGRATAELAGQMLDRDLLADLPDGVDPCGENGEFHTFVHDGPGFAAPLDVHVGEVVERDGFVFADVLPDSAAGAPVN
jgi:diphthamide synthase (EF-2-diphthine--ammonia ligase)